MTDDNPDIGAIVLAAGLSTRMGKPKMLLPWAGITVIESVIETLRLGGIARPVVVLGAGLDQLSRLLKDYPVQIAFNPSYTDGEMLHSLQVGLSVLDPKIQAVFIALGDQPQIQASTVRSLIEEYRKSRAALIIPSYQMRRGHPWLVGANLWPQLFALHEPETLRDFIINNEAEIEYVNVETPTVLMDLDTPTDYEKYQSR